MSLEATELRQTTEVSTVKDPFHELRLLSHRSMNGQLECHGSQEERKCQDRRPDPNNMEPLRAIDLRLPILGWRAGLPGERGTVDRDGADEIGRAHV